MNRYHKRSAIIILSVLSSALFLCSATSFAAIIFDNGPVDPTRVTWNDTSPSFTIYDDFLLTSPTDITGLNLSIFIESASAYQQTYISIVDGVTETSNTIISPFSAIGALSSNGLTTGNPNVPFGFDVAIDGLSLLLDPGTYFLGIRTETVSGLASIGSGPGSVQTIGTGLFQGFGVSLANGGSLRPGDHMAFQIIANLDDGPGPGSTPIPEPGTMLLLGTGLMGLAGARRKVRK